MTAPGVVLGQADADAYVRAFAAAVEALRLNRQFPDWERVREHLRAIHRSCFNLESSDTSPDGSGLRLDPRSGLPVPRAWIRARVEAELAGAAGLLPAREVHVALRNVRDGRASYAVRVDRLDVVSATVARYTLILADRPGRNVSEGELALRAADGFRAKLELLSTQDAALAFAALTEAGLEVEDVVRGVVGPALVPGRAGIEIPASGLVLSACLERASLDLQGQRVDDPLIDTIVLPANARFGLTRARKWAAPAADVPAVRAWLDARNSRGLVYGYPA